MPVPTSINDLSQTAGSNFPPGTEYPSSLNDVQQAHASFIALLRDGKGFKTGVALASSATTDIGGQNSFFVEISGTTTITSFGTNYNGPRYLRFTDVLQLTHNATTLILPGAANITTAAGDSCIVVPTQAGTGWAVVAYQKASLAPGVATSATTVTGTVANGVTGTTQSPGDNSTKLATTEYVDAATPDASTTVKGKVELADSTEAAAGTDTTRALTPSTLRSGLNATGTAPVYACRAWVNFDGTGTVAIRASGNVSSITDNGTGDYTVNFTTAMPDANYAVLFGGMPDTDYLLGVQVASGTTPTTSSVRITTGAYNTTRVDTSRLHVACIR